MFLDNSFGSRQTTATHRQKGKQEKTVSHASHVSHYLLSPLLQHVTYCSGISLLLLAMEGTGLTADGNEWQEMASICLQLSPKEPSKREALREACPFLWPTLFVKHPQEKEVPVTPHHHPTKYVQRKKHCIFFPKGVHIKSQSQFANRCPIYITVNQYLAAQTESLTGTEFSSKISTQLRIHLLLYFLKIPFWMLKETAAKNMNAPMAGYGYIHAMARPSSNFSLLFMTQEWDLTMLTVATHKLSFPI